MMKLSRLVRSAGPEKLLTPKGSLWAYNFTSVAGPQSFSLSPGTAPSKIFADYTVFKGKAALSARPVLTKPRTSESSNKYDKKKGCVMLTFWPAIGERKYDWQKKQLFALSPTELGSLISLETGKSAEFFHDPFMKSSNAGQVRKSLSVTPLADEGGYFFTLTVVNSALKTNERFSVPVNKGEFTVMRTAFSYILPHIMGWDQLAKQEQQPSSMSLNPTNLQEMRVSPNFAPNFEWDR